MRKLSAFMFHDVRDNISTFYPKRYAQRSFLSTKRFQEILDYISITHCIISPEDFEDVICSSSKTGDKPLAMLTFDDGLKDHIDVVLPRLIDRGVKAFFFLPAEALLKQRMIHSHKIQFILGCSASEKDVFSAVINTVINEAKQWNILIQESELISKYGESSHKKSTWSFEQNLVTRVLREFSCYELRNRVLNRLFSQFVTSDEQGFSADFYMNLTDVDLLLQNGMQLGGHGYHSINCAFEHESLQKSEIRLSHDFLLNNAFRRKNFSFIYSYPNGGISNVSIAELNELECKMAFTTEEQWIDNSNIDRLKLPRFDGTKIDV